MPVGSPEYLFIIETISNLFYRIIINLLWSFVCFKDYNNFLEKTKYMLTLL